MLLYRFPSCRSIRILMMRMSGPEPWMLPVGLVPQEADRRCDLVGVVGVNVAGLESWVGGDVSTSRQDTDGDLICCDGNKKNSNVKVTPAYSLCEMSSSKCKAGLKIKRNNYLSEFWQQIIDRGGEIKEAVAVTSQAGPGGTQAVNTLKQSNSCFYQRLII